jgi:hypothetical protein
MAYLHLLTLDGYGSHVTLEPIELAQYYGLNMKLYIHIPHTHENF